MHQMKHVRWYHLKIMLEAEALFCISIRPWQATETHLCHFYRYILRGGSRVSKEKRNAAATGHALGKNETLVVPKIWHCKMWSQSHNLITEIDPQDTFIQVDIHFDKSLQGWRAHAVTRGDFWNFYKCTCSSRSVGLLISRPGVCDFQRFRDPLKCINVPMASHSARTCETLLSLLDYESKFCNQEFTWLSPFYFLFPASNPYGS